MPLISNPRVAQYKYTDKFHPLTRHVELFISYFEHDNVEICFKPEILGYKIISQSDMNNENFTIGNGKYKLTFQVV